MEGRVDKGRTRTRSAVAARELKPRVLRSRALAAVAEEPMKASSLARAKSARR